MKLFILATFSLSLYLSRPDCAFALEPQVKILFLGDSLTEGYGISKKNSYPSLLGEMLKNKGKNIKILNGSISGSTSASAFSRLKWFLKGRPHIIFLALGANDALRGIQTKETKKNLSKVIELAKKNKIKVFVSEMMAPPNYGPEYGKNFKKIFRELAKEYQIKLIPFILKGVAGEKEFNQEDGIHPNEKGHKKMALNILPQFLSEIK